MDRPTYGLECGAESGDRQHQERGDRPNPGAEAVRGHYRRAQEQDRANAQHGVNELPPVRRVLPAGCICKPASAAILRAVDAAG